MNIKIIDKIFTGSQPLTSHLSDFGSEHRQITEAISSLSEHINSIKHLDKPSLDALDQIALESDELLRFIYFFNRCRYAYQWLESDSCLATINFTREITPRLNHPFIKYLSYLIDRIENGIQNNAQEAINSGYKALQSAPLGSYHHMSNLESLIMDAHETGNIQEIFNLSSMAKKWCSSNPSYESIVDLAKVFTHIYQLTPSELASLLKKLLPMRPLLKPAVLFHFHWRNILDPLPTRSQKILDDNDLPEPYNLRIRILQSLHKNNAGSVLPETLPSTTMLLDQFLLCDIHLASQHTQTAHGLIQKIQESHYLIDYYLARWHLLENRPALSWDHFQKFAKYSRKYFDDHQIRMLIAFSPEIPAHEACRWLSSNRPYELKSQKIPPTPITPPQTGDISQKLTGLQKQLNLLKKAAKTNQPVLITGETGSGKEWLARQLHKEKGLHLPFLCVNCSSLSPTLLESELFGHVKGAFTGADKPKTGFVEEAKDGILFLDEIGDMPLELQSSLLRLIENKEFRPVGSTRSRKTDCQIVCATNVDLDEAMQVKKFRKDLYYRIHAIHIEVPSLKNRKNDLEPLVTHFVKSNHPLSREVQLSSDLMQKLKSYDWPGNIRELRNEMEYLVTMDADITYYETQHLSQRLQKNLELISDQQNSTQSNPDENGTRNWHRLNRIDALKELFINNDRITRPFICHNLGISNATATADLKELLQTGEILKIMPNRSPRSHYFVFNKDK